MHYLSFCSYSSRPIPGQELVNPPSRFRQIPRIAPISLSYMGKQKIHVYDSSAEEGIDLKTPMFLQAPVFVRIRIRSPTTFFATAEEDPMYPNWKSISTRAPVNSLVLYSTQSVQLKPDYNLGPTFVRYWDKLPEELRVNIIAENMKAYPARQNPRFSMDLFTKLYPHCRMTPQIARIAMEGFYKHNEFLIQLNSGIPNRYPPAPFNDLIRRLHLTMYIRRSQWTFVRNLSEGKLGFAHLKYIGIVVSWHYPPQDIDGTEWDAFVDETFDHRIEFSCEGELSLLARSAAAVVSVPSFVRGSPAQLAMMQSRIRFAAKEAEA
ncbi:hypothetical protein P171DRAFT_440358 [Karstenula rhodostoma CBS 690.94]|uniref:Uncharacterized protein n=1 Tax=Karstenula rhodostoma CBS 690.94 TaxID=1392251 RepID=A0A9P4PTE9_9PLEO|nr:hypothetical protein P171DRAFT_440358 [Karstenula rhodostoma CBS 690.94]